MQQNLQLELEERLDYTLVNEELSRGERGKSCRERQKQFGKKEFSSKYSWYFYELQIKAQPLSALMPSAKKVVNTADWCATREELRQILDEIENLKKENAFSFRQLKRGREQAREKCHWDYLLKEMKWMHQDFKGEKRWKINAAKVVGGWILEYFRTRNRIIQENESPWGKLVYSNDIIQNEDACETFYDGNKEYQDSIPSVMAVSRLFNTEIKEYWQNSEQDISKDKDPVIHEYLFGQNDEYLMTEPKAQNETGPEIVWSSEEDDMLFSLASIYQHNWELLADILYSSRASCRKRSDRDCYTRYTNLSSRGYKPSMEYDSFGLPIRQEDFSLFTNRHADLERFKLARFMTKFDQIGKTLKKKETPKQSTSKSNKGQVNLNSHETHMQSQIHAGVDILGRPLTPMELTQLKEMRNNELRVAQEQQKHAALFSGISRGMPRGGIAQSPSGYPTHRHGSYGLASPVLQTMTLQKSSPTIPERRFSASSPLNSPGRGPSPVQQDVSSSHEKHSVGSPLISTISNQPPVDMQSSKARQQIQNDVQTAAALVALQNVKNQTMIKEEGNSVTSPRTLRRKK